MPHDVIMALVACGLGVALFWMSLLALSLMDQRH